MTKLITKFQKNPSAFNRNNLQSYLFRHPMATVFATAEELAFLRVHEFII